LSHMTLDFGPDGAPLRWGHRRCGDCTLCCTLVPIKSMRKPAGVKCQHQCHKGCRIYDRRPLDCQLWSCGWLLGMDTEDMRRPDRVGYVIDLLPEMIHITPRGGTASIAVPAMQVWADPRRPDDWRRDNHLIDYIERRGWEGCATIIRHSAAYGTVILCVAFGPWSEHYDRCNFDLKPSEAWQEEKEETR